MEFPTGAEFAFSILDDTDDSTRANAAPFYALLKELGLRTTKTVWPIAVSREEQGPFFAGSTLEDPEYAEWVRSLVSDGFEVASHNASMGSSLREQTRQGQAITRRETGAVMRLHCNHAQNLENLYWGSARYRSFPLGAVARLLERLRGHPRYLGHVPDSPYFWGDIALAEFDYIRSFAFNSMSTDMLSIPPVYADDTTPWVARWFITADAPDAHAFRRLVTREAVDALRCRRGHVIVSTHIGKDFVDSSGVVDEQISDTLRYISSLNGWFVPVSTLLDWLGQQVGIPTISSWQRLRMELLHVADRGRFRFSTHS
jgi:hypothetical protein